MQTVTVSSKLELALPVSICEALHIKPGQQIQVIQFENRIELIPRRDIREARGFLRGIDTAIERDQDRV